MTLRIVHVVRQYAPSIGGLESVVARLAADQQKRLGHEVRIVTLDRVFGSDRLLPRSDAIDGVAVLRLRWAGSTRYPLCPQVLAHLGDADLVHVHAIDFFFDWLSATRWLHRKPMVASTHGGFFHTAYASTLKRIWFDTITRVSAMGYRRIAATSRNDGDVFRRIAGDRVVVVENGADVERFRDAASRTADRTLIYFGRWSSNKGLPQLIELLAALRIRDPAWRLIVAGRPFDLDAAALTAHAMTNGVIDAVELHESPTDDALRALVGRASHFACLSRHEGFGIAAIEAMSAGLRLVLSDIPPFRRIVDDSGHGVLLPLHDGAEANALRIVDSLQDADDRRHRIDFTNRYEWSQVVDRYDALYDDALAHPRAEPRVRPS